jgi:hypothetical protein
MPSVQFPASREFSMEFFGKEPQRERFSRPKRVHHQMVTGKLPATEHGIFIDRAGKFIEGAGNGNVGPGGRADPTLWLERDGADRRTAHHRGRRGSRERAERWP